MIPKLFKSNDYALNGNGYGLLSETLKCEVAEERNGEFTLSLDYPLESELADYLRVGNLILAKNMGENQLFRIIKAPRDTEQAIIAVEGEHISYDLLSYPIKARINFDSTKAANLFNPYNADFIGVVADKSKFPPFRFSHDSETLEPVKFKQEVAVSNNMRHALYGAEGSLLQRQHGEFYFTNNGFNINFTENRGQRKNIILRYGSEIISANVEESLENVWTHIYPFSKPEGEDGNGEYLLLPNGILASKNADKFAYERIKPVDLTEKAGHALSTLKVQAKQYMKENKFGVPKFNLKIGLNSFRNNAYGDEMSLGISLCDTIFIFIERLNLKFEAKIIKTVYDSIKEELVEIELGDEKQGLKDVLGLNFNSQLESVKAVVNSGLDEKMDNKITAEDGKVYKLIITKDEKGQPIFKFEEVI